MFEDVKVRTPERLQETVQSVREAMHDLELGTDESALVDLLSELELLKAAAAAAQVRVTTQLWQQRRETTGGVKGLGAEIGLARKESPHKGSRLITMATALVKDMPRTLEALETGVINEHRAMIMVRETALLARGDRRQVDEEMDGLMGGLGDRKLADRARKIGLRLDPTAAQRRARDAERGRHVSLREAPDSMSWLTGHLPAAQGLMCMAVLRLAADEAQEAGDPRSRGQIMSDTLVDRLLGHDEGNTRQVQVHLTMPYDALFGDSHEPGHLDGYGVIPAAVARRIVRKADKVWLRRVFTRPGDGDLIAMESRSRVFDGLLRRFVILRDETCRTPWCDAPIRQIDHIHPWAKGGETDIDNAQGLCVRCNQTKEIPGWKTRRTSHYRHSTEIITPTKHAYGGRRPTPRPDFSYVGRRLFKLAS